VRPVLRIAGISVSGPGTTGAARQLVALAAGPRLSGVDVQLCRAGDLGRAHVEPEFGALLRDASVTLVEGRVAGAALRLFRGGLPAPGVSARDLVLSVASTGRDAQLRHYLVGPDWDTVGELESLLRQRFPSVLVVGTDSPRSRTPTGRERADQATRIRSVGAQVVWVGLDARRRHEEAARLAERLDAVVIAVGDTTMELLARTGPGSPRWLHGRRLRRVHRLAVRARRHWDSDVIGVARLLAAGRRARPVGPTPDRNHVTGEHVAGAPELAYRASPSRPPSALASRKE
jgi:N-acetylglucosaminyldiphosphoundecaprenol N-acetyl-beta-D-mannosaminyltransferase